MSIWCSGDPIGTEPDIEPQTPRGGNVLSYAEGFSNHYPDLTGSHERPAAIATSWIPSWCVPGQYHEGTDNPGPWLRIEVACPEALNFWTRPPKVEELGATVVLDEDAVRELRDDLTRWLDQPKTRPSGEDA